MANHVSALKRMRVTERRTAVNKQRKTRVRHAIRSLRRAIESKNTDEAVKMLPQTFGVVDRAVKWGIIKDNTAARYKSRLHRKLKALEAA